MHAKIIHWAARQPRRRIFLFHVVLMSILSMFLFHKFVELWVVFSFLNIVYSLVLTELTWVMITSQEAIQNTIDVLKVVDVKDKSNIEDCVGMMRGIRSRAGSRSTIGMMISKPFLDRTDALLHILKNS